MIHEGRTVQVTNPECFFKEKKFRCVSEDQDHVWLQMPVNDQQETIRLLKTDVEVLDL